VAYDILHEQLAYYRARAQEYDESIEAAWEFKGAFALARRLLLESGPFEQALDLACGTGIWTQVLLQISSHVTAIDASPEMLAIARQKTGDRRISYKQADLFQWEPEHQYDLVFFANWLSHVPPAALDAFLTRVSYAVRTGGYLVILDQSAPTLEDQQIMKEGEDGCIYAERSLLNGESFTIIKVFYNITALREALAARGFEGTVSRLSEVFFFLTAKKRSQVSDEKRRLLST